MWTRTYRLALCVLFGSLLWVMGVATPATAQTGAPGDWTWMGGSSTISCLYIPCALNAVYGTLGTPAAGNSPGSRSPAASWTDKEGNLWLFGGAITYMATPDDLGCRAFMNDLWEFNPSTNEWTWVSGSNPTTLTQTPLQVSDYTCGQVGVYGTLGVSAAGNVPGGRLNSLEWTDSSGDFWIFGGYGFDIKGAYGYLNDLWMFNPSTGEWTWMGGSSALTCAVIGPPYCGQIGVYGTLGIPASGNVPDGLGSATGWSDSSGRFWLFGGEGYDPTRNSGFDVNDLWQLDPAANEWTWMGGSKTGQQPGVYGTLGSPAAGNTPGSRSEASGWADNAGNLWLFGGDGADANGAIGDLNDLWEFNPFTQEWAWMGGSSTLPSTCTSPTDCGQPGTYGTLGVAAQGNTPGGRASASIWTDGSGNAWLFGGQGVEGNATFGALNDLWGFNPSTNEWAWMGGSSALPTTCTTKNICGQPGVYGTEGVPAAGNIPGGRSGATKWTDGSGNLWLYGGDGLDSVSGGGYLNDLWEFTPPAGSAPPAARPVFSEASGTYTSAQTVSISDDTTGATVYYTTDGVTIPTALSKEYSGPIKVSSTETIIAVAVSSGFSNSPVASAIYTIKLPPTFTIAALPVSFTVAAGSSGTTTVSVTPANGFNSAVSFACSGLPAGATCSFAPATVTPTGTAAASTTLTVSTASTSAEMRRGSRPLLPVTALAVLLCCLGMRRRRGVFLVVLLAVSAAGLVLVSACGGGGSGGSGPPPIQPVTSTITVTATSGTLQSTTTFSLTVD